MKRGISYSYCVFRLEKKHWTEISQELSSHGYKNIRPIVPIVRVLKKSKANKSYYEEVPLLFNYGFMKMPTKLAFDRQFLRKLKRDIAGIQGFLQNTVPMHPRKQRNRIDNAEDWDDFSKVATVSREQVKYYRRIAKKNKIYSPDDITRLHIGDYITLHGYPFEGMGAEITEINLNTHKVGLKITMSTNSILNIQVSMEHVFYSIYNDFDDNKITAAETDLINLMGETDGSISGEGLGLPYQG